MTDKRQKAKKVKCKREESLTKQSIFLENSLLQKKHLSFAGARWQMNTTLHQNRPEDTQNWTNLYLEPHDYRIYYVNIDLRHQYGISVAESQTFLRTKRPQWQRARRNRCFRRLCQVLLAELSQEGQKHTRPRLYRNASWTKKKTGLSLVYKMGVTCNNLPITCS